MASLLTEKIAALVGSKAVYHAPDEIGRSSIRYFASAIGSTNPLYTDPEFAREHGHPDVIAPPTFICETNQYMTGATDEHGYLGHVWDLIVPDTRLIRGGNEYEFHRPVLPTDHVTATWQIADITERTSSSGKQLLIVISEARYTDRNGSLLATNRETLIYQEL